MLYLFEYINKYIIQADKLKSNISMSFKLNVAVKHIDIHSVRVARQQHVLVTYHPCGNTVIRLRKIINKTTVNRISLAKINKLVQCQSTIATTVTPT